MIFCEPLYDNYICDFIDEFVETSLKNKNKEEFIYECIYDLKHYTHSENDYTIIDKYNLLRYMLKNYTPEQIFKSLNGKKAAKILKEFSEIEFMEEMITDHITLEDMLCLYYIAYIHHNKDKIIKYLLDKM